MILIGLILQLIILMTVKKNQVYYVLGVGVVSAIINYFDIFSEIVYLKTSIDATTVYLIVLLSFLSHELLEKNIKSKNILWFSFIFATMNIHIITLTLLLTFIINQKTQLFKKQKRLLTGVVMLTLGNSYFFSTDINSIFLFIGLLLIGFGLLRTFTATIFSYYIVTAFVTIYSTAGYELWLLIAFFGFLFVLRKIILIRKEKLIRNNFIDKLTFLLLIGEKEERVINRDSRVAILKNEKHQVRNKNIINDENIIDTSLIILMIGLLVFVGVRYGNI